jgi:uncharacterized protein YyaL (SSP411 family)
MAAPSNYPAENLLGRETSPYLLQHQANPVHWRPWGEAAFAEAKARDVPILLSVGYAACHWCHVMAHESFEDAGTAKLMNDLFVNVKVDREERPDVDQIYMSALHLMGEQGGWPLTMFLTPDGQPFWGGTYFPPEPRYGRASFKDVLHGISQAWKDKRDQVGQNVQTLLDALKARQQSQSGGRVESELLDRIANHFGGMFDGVHGGLKGAPKFPQSSILELMWRAYRRNPKGDWAEPLRRLVITTLDRMSQGGIYDHLGGGFARYSTDAQWLVPHFEKMLYDNAQLIDIMALVWQETKSDLYETRIAETIEWVKREMIAENGCFAATLDADSEGEEGKFYVWTSEEIDRLLGPEAAFFKAAYDVTEGGNWEDHAILNRSKTMLLGDAAHEQRLAKARKILFDARAKRIPPGRDDKVLADWNGLMIEACAHAGFVFDRQDWVALGARAFDGVMTHLRGPAGAPDAGRLRHSFRQGRAQHMAMLDDYANMARAAVALYEVTGEGRYLDQAEQLVADADRYYCDKDGGGYFFTAIDAPTLITRTKSAHDNATPSGNGIMAATLGRLYVLTGKTAYRDRAEATIGAFAGELQQNFFPLATLLNAADVLERPLQVAVIGRRDEVATHGLLRALAVSASLPNHVLQIVPPGSDLPASHPAHGKGQLSGKPTVYICEGPVCSAPLTDPVALAEDLKQR